MKITPSLLALLTAGNFLCAPAVHASVLLELAGANLKNAAGAAIPNGSGLLVVVASTANADFTPLTSASSLVPGSAVSAGSDDIVIFKSAVSGDGQQDGSVAAGEFRQALDLVYANGVAAGNPVMLYWFPTLKASSTAVGTGIPYGSYRASIAASVTEDEDGSEPWVLPADGTSGRTLLFLTADAGSAINTGVTGIATSVSDGTAVPSTDPIANPDQMQVSGATLLDLLSNDTDPNNYALTVASVTQPAKGTASLSGGAVTYTPGTSASGSDTFTYTISNGHNGTAVGTVTVNIVSAPVTVSPKGNYIAQLTASGTWAGRVTASVTAAGAVSGRLVLNGTAYTFTGTATNGVFTKSIARSGKTALALTLIFGSDASGNPTVTASVTGDATTYASTASAPLATAPLATAPAGRYNILLPGSSVSGRPYGTGWISLVISSSASISGVGRLQDGTTFSFASALCVDGSASFLATIPYATPTGFLNGTLLFNTAGTEDVTGTFTLVKPARTNLASTVYFPAGFAMSGSLTGDRYTVPATALSAIGSTASTAVTATISTGPSATPLTQGAVVPPNGVAVDSTPVNFPLTLRFLPAYGVITGSVTPTGGIRSGISGVLRQRAQTAGGLFYTSNQTGSFTIVPK